MAREINYSTTSSMSSSSLHTNMSKAPVSRLPVKSKKPVLGERIENFDHSTPRQHLVKPVKSVIKPRVSSSKLKLVPRVSSTSSQATPARTVSYAPSPVQSTTSSPAGANISRPGHTPHPRRSSVGLSQLINDQSLLMDTTQGFLDSDTDASDADEPAGGNMLVRKGIMGPGRLMTPANSQETQQLSQETRDKEPSPRRLAMRLPTPPSSQPGTDTEAVLARSLVRARPAPTPPRKTATPSIRLNGVSAPASPTQDISPNPRRKKSPRVDEAGPSRLRSPFELEASTSNASPRHPRDRVEVIIGRSPRVSTPSSTPKPCAKTAKRGRLSTKTPGPHPLSQSTSSQTGRGRKAPATAPPANRRKSTPGTIRKKQTPRTSLPPAKVAKTPRLSVRNISRKSVTPAELKAMAGLLPEPVEQGSPSDDPLLLVDDDQDYFSKTPTTTRPSRPSSSKSTARIIDFDAAIGQGSSRSSRSHQEPVVEYEVPLQGSEPEYEDGPIDHGFDSGGDSDDDDQVGNDTFVHTAGGRSRSAVGLDLMARPVVEENEEQEDEEAPQSHHLSSQPPSPFLPRISHSQESSRSPLPFTTTGPDAPRTVEEHPASSPAQHIPSPQTDGSPIQQRQDSVSPMASPRVSRSPEPSALVNSGLNTATAWSPSAPLPTQSASPLEEVKDYAEHHAASSPARSTLSRIASPQIDASPRLSSPSTSALDAQAPRTSSASPPILRLSPVVSVSHAASPVATRSRSSTPIGVEKDITVSPATSHRASPYVSFSPVSAGKLESSPARASAYATSPAASRSRSLTPARVLEQVASSPAASHHASFYASSSPVVAGTSDSSPARGSSATPRVASAELDILEDQADEDDEMEDDVTLLTARSRTSTPKSVRLAASPARSSASYATSPSTVTGSLSPASFALEQISQGIPWSAEHLVPGTPSMLGLFMPDQADAQSTPHPSARSGSGDDNLVSQISSTEEEEACSTTPTAPLPASLAPFSSPRGSPAQLPDLEPEEDDSFDDQMEEESEDKENLPPVQLESTTPPASPPVGIKYAPSPVYTFTFSPRITSPLRIAHHVSPSPGPISRVSSPFAATAASACAASGRGRSTSYSPIPAVESVNDRFGDLVHDHQDEEGGECASGDVTLEGNSADWSLSDGELELQLGGAVEVDEEERSEAEESSEAEINQSEPELQVEEEPSVEQSNYDASAEEETDAALQVSTPVPDSGFGGQDDDEVLEAEEEAINAPLESSPVSKSNAAPETFKDQDEQDAQSEDSESEMGDEASSDTLADAAGFESDPEDEEDKVSSHEDASPQASSQFERHASPSPAPAPAPASAPTPAPASANVSEKIILRLVDRGIVKIEQEEETAASTLTPPSPRPALNKSANFGPALDASVRSTTPAYDPPTRSMAAGVRTPRPAADVSLYPQMPATPVFAPLPELSSSTPLASPPAYMRPSQVQPTNTRSDDANANANASTLAGPSTRPRSRLSRPVSEAREEQDEADASIRVRSASALGHELDNADNSMRSVVEVSSFDPKAAARAAAILKLNHAYIEHGDISKLGDSQRPESPRRRSFHSSRLDKLDASRRDDKTDLLYEAELEIVSTRRSRSRSMSRFRGVSEAATELALPGAWNGTPQAKRKRTAHAHSYDGALQPVVEENKTTPTWGVSQWKKLEKVFRAERELWVTERQVKTMPGGFIGWARMSTFGPAAPVAKPWEPMRVVNRFMEEQNVPEDDQVGDWSLDILKTRVEALERHAEHRKVRDQAKGKDQEGGLGAEARSPKKIKTADTPTVPAAAATAAPSTVRKLLGWVLPGSTRKEKEAPASSPASATPTATIKTVDRKGKARAESPEIREEWLRPMSQLGSSVSIPVAHTGAEAGFDTPLHPSSPAWKTARPAPPLFKPALDQARPTPRTLSAILADSSSSSSAADFNFNANASTNVNVRNPLSLSFSQKSAALDALFGGSTSASAARAVRVPIVKRVASVKDMVKGFEESGAFEAMKGRK